MNKRDINGLIPKAYVVLEEVNIANNGEVEKAYRGQISSFGAAITTGSLISAVAFFSQKGQSAVDRRSLIKAINILVNPKGSKDKETLFDYLVRTDEAIAKEQVVNAAIALKLAMNLYKLVEPRREGNE